MKIVTLVENLVYVPKLQAEHGLSILIKDNQTKVLFDLGQSNLYYKNARMLNIDISTIKHLVLSHGHYDHTGGLKNFLETNKKSKVHINSKLFHLKYASDCKRYIGVPQNIKIGNKRFIINDSNITKVSKNIFIIRNTPIINMWDIHFNKMKIKRNGQFYDDQFEDEQSLICVDNKKIYLISGCSHRGITNIILWAEKLFDKKITDVIAGIHTKNTLTHTTLKKYKYFFKQHKIQNLYLSHCTGINEFTLLKNNLNCNVIYNHTAMCIS